MMIMMIMNDYDDYEIRKLNFRYTLLTKVLDLKFCVDQQVIV